MPTPDIDGAPRDIVGFIELVDITVHEQRSAQVYRGSQGHEPLSANARRHLAFAGIGASEHFRGAKDSDETLAEGFGRS